MLPAINVTNSPNGEAILHLQGEWTVAHLSRIEKLLSIQKPKNPSSLTLDGQKLEALDTSAAWLLVRFLRQKNRASKSETQLMHFNEHFTHILTLVGALAHTDSPHCYYCGPIRQFFLHLGQASFAMVAAMHEFMAFFGQICLTLVRTIRHPSKLRVSSVVYHINEICIRAIPIIALMGFLISLVMGYQGAHQLEKFGAKIFTIDLIAISMLREMGVIITSIMVAGRSGSAFAAQLGVMQVNDEVDAMRTIGLDPFELLILPRVIAIMIALPILTLLADIMGIFGALFVSASIVDISLLQFAERLHTAININTLLIGLVKAPIFALLIGMVGCLQGMQVKNSATEVGARTTTAVVQSIFLVLMFDALFSILFTVLDI